MDRRPGYSWRIEEPPVLIPNGYITVADAVARAEKLISEVEPRISGCSPAEHFLRCLLHSKAIIALFQLHINGRCFLMPPEGWSEPKAPRIFDDGMIYVEDPDDLSIDGWASVRINEAQLVEAFSNELRLRESSEPNPQMEGVNPRQVSSACLSLNQEEVVTNGGGSPSSYASEASARRLVANLLRTDPFATRAKAQEALRAAGLAVTGNRFQNKIWPKARADANLPEKAAAGKKRSAPNS